MTLTVQRSDEAGVTALRPQGELDLSTVGELRAQIAEVMDGDGPIQLDLSGLTFMDSLGVGVLVKLRRDCEARQRPLEIVGATGAVAEVIRHSGVSRFLADGR